MRCARRDVVDGEQDRAEELVSCAQTYEVTQMGLEGVWGAAQRHGEDEDGGIRTVNHSQPQSLQGVAVLPLRALVHPPRRQVTTGGPEVGCKTHSGPPFP